MSVLDLGAPPSEWEAAPPPLANCAINPPPARPIDAFCAARRAMFDAWLGLLGSRYAAQDIDDEIAATAVAMRHLAQLAR
jgi:hypothetical protein